MIIRGDSVFNLFIKTEPLTGVVRDDDEVEKKLRIEFSGIRIELNNNEVSDIIEAINYLSLHPNEHLVFRGEREKRKMMKWYYDRGKKGGPVELDFLHRTGKEES